MKVQDLVLAIKRLKILADTISSHVYLDYMHKQDFCETYARVNQAILEDQTLRVRLKLADAEASDFYLSAGRLNYYWREK